MKLLSRYRRTRELVMPSMISVAVVFIIIAIIVLGSYLFASYLRDRDREHLSLELDSLSDDLEAGIELHMVELDMMDALYCPVEQQTELDSKYLNFSVVISGPTTGVVGVVVVKGDDLLFVFPEDIRDHAKNWSLMVSNIQGLSEDIDEMIAQGTARLMGPFELWDGRTCIIAGNPVSDPWEPPQFQAIILDLTVLLSGVGFLDEALPFDIEFRDQDGDTF
ncbi:MAG: hypothetical protein JW939_00355, partial [Candidatus Thermoplasmatota archaeon]|nr:hypothetical protein [Candidatus Thermoplasmatota archaeon]